MSFLRFILFSSHIHSSTSLAIVNFFLVTMPETLVTLDITVALITTSTICSRVWVRINKLHWSSRPCSSHFTSLWCQLTTTSSCCSGCCCNHHSLLLHHWLLHSIPHRLLHHSWLHHRLLHTHHSWLHHRLLHTHHTGLHHRLLHSHHTGLHHWLLHSHHSWLLHAHHTGLHHGLLHGHTRLHHWRLHWCHRCHRSNWLLHLWSRNCNWSISWSSFYHCFFNSCFSFSSIGHTN